MTTAVSEKDPMGRSTLQTSIMQYAKRGVLYQHICYINHGLFITFYCFLIMFFNCNNAIHPGWTWSIKYKIMLILVNFLIRIPLFPVGFCVY